MLKDNDVLIDARIFFTEQSCVFWQGVIPFFWATHIDLEAQVSRNNTQGTQRVRISRTLRRSK